MVRIDLAPAEDKLIMRRLVDAYATEMAAYGEGEPLRYFEAYWRDASRWPYLIQRDAAVVGFVWVNTWSPSGRGTDFAVAEFYVAPEARRSGVGRDAAAAVFQAHPGRWELAVLPSNAAALIFWLKAIAAVEGRDAERLDVAGQSVFRFRMG